MKREHAAREASGCRHYAMCRIDYAGTGLCPSGRRNLFVSYWPQGLMDIAAGVLSGKIPVTRGILHAVEECDLCGLCQGQCNFITGLRPLDVFRELKSFLRDAVPVDDTEESPLVNELRAIVGEGHIIDDPGLLYAYAGDPCPVSRETMPLCAVLPLDADQVSLVVRACLDTGVPWAVRGNGSSVMGFVLSPGVIIDTARMKTLDFDTSNRAVTAGAGVSAFQLQKEAASRGFRVNAAEPAALYCANLMCSGIFSLFSSSLGTGADNIIDARFVDGDGRVFTLSERGAPNLYCFAKEDRPPPGICTEAVVRLYPVEEDESGLAVPFHDLASAVSYAARLNRRGIGLGIGVLGVEYLATFTTPTAREAVPFRNFLRDTLGLEYLVVVLGNTDHLRAAAESAPFVYGQELMSSILRGIPGIIHGGLEGILEGAEGNRRPYEILAGEGMEHLVGALLEASGGDLAGCADPDVADFYRGFYQSSDLTDMLFLNTFRSVSSRMGREGHVVAFILYVPLDDPSLVETVHREFARVAENHGVRGDIGFLTPIDHGAMGVLEWDMYGDHTDPVEVQAMAGAMEAAGAMIEGLSAEDPRILWIRYVFNQGFSRKESFLYHGAALK